MTSSAQASSSSLCDHPSTSLRAGRPRTTEHPPMTPSSSVPPRKPSRRRGRSARRSAAISIPSPPWPSSVPRPSLRRGPSRTPRLPSPPSRRSMPGPRGLPRTRPRSPRPAPRPTPSGSTPRPPPSSPRRTSSPSSRSSRSSRPTTPRPRPSPTPPASPPSPTWPPPSPSSASSSPSARTATGISGESSWRSTQLRRTR